MAVLSVLADRAPAPQRREAVQTLFWGERSEEKARHSLRQVVLQLRRACGTAFEANATTLRVAAESMHYDAREFAAAATGQRYRAAVDLWTGDFLIGCDDIGAEGFRAWLDVERERLRRLLALSYEATVKELVASDDRDAALAYAGRWTEHFPLDESAHQQLIAVLCGTDRGADATVVRSTFIRRFEADMGHAPSDEWLMATDEVISLSRRPGAAPIQNRPEGSEAMSSGAFAASAGALEDHDRLTRTPPRLVAKAVAYAVALSLAVVALGVLATRRGMGSGNRQVLAVGEIKSAFAADSMRGFSTLLSISLARIGDIDLINERRMSEVGADMRSDNLAAVARAAGAREIIEGVLARRANGALRADLRRTDLLTGKTLATYAVEGADATELADLLTEEVARNLEAPAPVARPEGTTRSIIAYRFYEQGLRAFHENDATAARRFFAAALAEDSTFAMAALYSAAVVGDSSDAYMARAVRYARRTNERERLLINIAWGKRMADTSVIYWADTLVTRYPSDPESQLVYALQVGAGANPGLALAPFRRVISMDSSIGRATGRCRACEAFGGMLEVYRRIDSLATAEQVARAWLRWQPHSTPAWIAYSRVLGESDRLAEAHAAVDSASKYSPGGDAYLMHEQWWFRANDYEAVDRAWRKAEQSAIPDQRLDGVWTHVISSRAQGRMQDAMAAARLYRRERLKVHDTGAGLLEAVVLSESGHPHAAALLFDSLANTVTGPFASRRAASRAWALSHAAGAYALVRDTVALQRLEDSVRVNGMIATDRFKRLHHYVRGLRLSVTGKPAEAADEFRKAVWRRQETHVRIYLELGRSLIAAGRPAEAIAPLIEALNGPVSSSGLYATRTDLQELLALAYERAGRRDRAIAQYTLVSRAWRAADPQFRPRRLAAEAGVARLSRAEGAR
ncbi:MAG: BTAD domain-containing putative transcriptional regulator [Gemmatimonadota bacterium]